VFSPYASDLDREAKELRDVSEELVMADVKAERVDPVWASFWSVPSGAHGVDLHPYPRSDLDRKIDLVFGSRGGKVMFKPREGVDIYLPHLGRELDRKEVMIE